MNLILGASTKTISIKADTCLCAYCNTQSTYKIKRDTVFFTLLFIPLIPLYANKQYAQCTSCKTIYVPSAEQLNLFSGSSYTIASLVNRMFALLIDIVLLFIGTMLLAVFIGKHPELEASLPDNFILVFLPCWFMYFFLTELFSKGYSIGKRILSIKVSSNKRLSYLNIGQSFCRSLLKTASCIFPFIFLVSCFTNRNRAIHDLVANSVVITKIKITNQ